MPGSPSSPRARRAQWLAVAVICLTALAIVITTRLHSEAAEWSTRALHLEAPGELPGTAALADVPSPAAPPFPPGLPFLEALAGCATLDCVRAAHAQPRGAAGPFNFPHFFIAGFQKSATTSLFWNLAQHPQLLPPSVKEPEFFSNGCGWELRACPAAAAKAYIVETLRLGDFLRGNATRGAFEGSTHYARALRLPAQLHSALPWVKVVVLLREPISRAASMLIHNNERHGKGCLAAARPMGDCLLEDSQLSGWQGPANYSLPLARWLGDFPPEQVHVIQYEALTSTEGEHVELRGVNDFLEMDPGLSPHGLGRRNSRRERIQPAGWEVGREQYKALVAKARADTEALVELLHSAGRLRGGAAWAARWEEVWAGNLERCGAGGRCRMQLS